MVAEGTSFRSSAVEQKLDPPARLSDGLKGGWEGAATKLAATMATYFGAM